MKILLIFSLLFIIFNVLFYFRNKKNRSKTGEIPLGVALTDRINKLIAFIRKHKVLAISFVAFYFLGGPLLSILIIIQLHRVPSGLRGPFKIGVLSLESAIPIIVAEKKGFFKDERLFIRIEELEPCAMYAAYSEGALDLITFAPDYFVCNADPKLTGKIIMPVYESAGNDGIVAKTEIVKIADLKGKKVGFQWELSSFFFFLYLLDQSGLTLKDINREHIRHNKNMAPLFADKKIDAVVTLEPWLFSTTKIPNTHVIATSRDTPGLLVDALMVSDKIMKKDRGDVVLIMKACFRAVDYIKENKEESVKILAKAARAEPGAIRDMLNKSHLFGLEESRTYLGTPQKPGKLFDVFQLAIKLYKKNGLIETQPNINDFVDASFLQELMIK